MKKFIFVIMAGFAIGLGGTSDVRAGGVTEAECRAAGATYNSTLKWCTCPSSKKWDDSTKKCITRDQCIKNRNGNELGVACCFEDNAVWTGSSCQCVDQQLVFVVNEDLYYNRRAEKGGRCVNQEYRSSCKTYLDAPLKAAKDISGLSDGLIDDINSLLTDCLNNSGFLRNDEYVNRLAEINLRLTTELHAIQQKAIAGLDAGGNNVNVNVNMGADVDIYLLQSLLAELKVSAPLNALGALVAQMEDDASVWKTEDGKFNTARLASDSIAAVVLGTAGAVITSNVIKKNQIEDGFEDIQCTIGGQAVAGWHDEFRVGIQ